MALGEYWVKISIKNDLTKYPIWSNSTFVRKSEIYDPGNKFTVGDSESNAISIHLRFVKFRFLILRTASRC